jgi:hypothetical protein
MVSASRDAVVAIEEKGFPEAEFAALTADSPINTSDPHPL